MNLLLMRFCLGILLKNRFYNDYTLYNCIALYSSNGYLTYLTWCQVLNENS